MNNKLDIIFTIIYKGREFSYSWFSVQKVVRDEFKIFVHTMYQCDEFRFSSSEEAERLYNSIVGLD